MTLLETIEINFQGQIKLIELYQGDLTNLAKNEHFDLLVLSAFPNDYTPTPTSLVGALNRKGLSVDYLSMLREVDMREEYACWLSSQIDYKDYNGIEFKRILCFEPLIKDLPPSEMIRDLFQALMVLTNQYDVKSVGMPLITTGDANYPVDLILNPLIEAAVNWMSLGLDLDKIKIVAYDTNKARQALIIFKILKEKYSNYSLKFSHSYEYDYFISYSHKDIHKAEYLHEKLKKLKPNSKVFIDKNILHTGHAWQMAIFEALDNCAKIITLLSNDYINSKVCKEEYNIAHFRQRESEHQVLLPVYLYSCLLPTYMKLTQYLDCREGLESKLEEAALSFCE